MLSGACNSVRNRGSSGSRSSRTTNRHNDAADAARRIEMSLPRLAARARHGLADFRHGGGRDGVWACRCVVVAGKFNLDGRVWALAMCPLEARQNVAPDSRQVSVLSRPHPSGRVVGLAPSKLRPQLLRRAIIRVFSLHPPLHKALLVKAERPPSGRPPSGASPSRARLLSFARLHRCLDLYGFTWQLARLGFRGTAGALVACHHGFKQLPYVQLPRLPAKRFSAIFRIPDGAQCKCDRAESETAVSASRPRCG